MPTVPAVDPDFILALRRIVGSDGVLADPNELLVYECDAYTLERRLPQLVVLPRAPGEVAEVVRECHRRAFPIIPRGAGTSLSGAVLAVDGGVAIVLSRMNRVLDIDPVHRRALVEAGCVNIRVSQAAAPHGLLYAPDPSSQSACTLGGNIGTNSGGPHTLKLGVTTHHVLGLELVLPNGTPVWLGTAPGEGEEDDGIDLRGVVIGAEGMFGVVTRALLRLIPAPADWRTLLGIFESVEDASRAVSDIIAAGIVPAALEMMDRLITRAVEEAYHVGFPPDAGAVLIVELDGDPPGLEPQAEQIEEICRRHRCRSIRAARDAAERAAIWKSRKRAFGAIGRLSPNYLTQDGVVPRSRLPEIMDFIARTAERHRLRIPNVFHAGDGNIHPLVLYDESDPDQVRRAVTAGHEILEQCLALGGSVSGEHGIGVEKIDFMSRQFDAPSLAAMHRLRDVFDPDRRCNPHKVLPGGRRCLDFVPSRQAAV